jgi:hypothetical protein
MRGHKPRICPQPIEYPAEAVLAEVPPEVLKIMAEVPNQVKRRSRIFHLGGVMP